MVKGLKLKVRKFLGLIPMFAEVTGEKLVGGIFAIGRNVNILIVSYFFVIRFVSITYWES